MELHFWMDWIGERIEVLLRRRCRFVLLGDWMMMPFVSWERGILIFAVVGRTRFGELEC